jgi:hypothetical protein
MFNRHARRAIESRDSLAREVAERSVAATVAELSVIADNMSLAELRGYVRGHALPIVREEANQLVGYEWPQKAFNELVASALEQAMHLIVQQLRLQPIAAVPTPHVRLRIAA